jgi:abequosyltransferase
MNSGVLLTVVIPTFNRAGYLDLCLANLVPQMREHGDAVELVILDNASADNTPQVAGKYQAQCPALVYLRNPENIGSDRNIAEGFNRARGRYVWVLGDDDVPLEGTISWLVLTLSDGEAGLVYLRPFGFDRDFRSEFPGSSGRTLELDSIAAFLSRVGPHIGLISAIAVNKSLIPDVDARGFCGTNLVQVEVYLSAALRAKRFLYSEPYRVAYKRLNTGGFDFSRVFVENLGKILDRYCAAGLPQVAAEGLGRSMLIRYFPYHVWKLRSSREGNLAAHRVRFDARYRDNPWYRLLVRPIFTLPRALALVWGLLAVFAGRLASGDFRRGMYFAVNWVRQRYQRG